MAGWHYGGLLAQGNVAIACDTAPLRCINGSEHHARNCSMKAKGRKMGRREEVGISSAITVEVIDNQEEYIRMLIQW